MRTEFRFVDINQAPQGLGLPAIVVAREGGGAYYVPEQPFDRPFNWLATREGSFVRVPLYRFQSNGRQPSVAMAFAFELGARCVLQAPCVPKKLFLAVGVPVEDLAAVGGPDALVFWIGVALQE